MKETIKNYLKELSDGTKKMFKEFLNKDTNKKQRANMWTFARLLISLPIFLFSILLMFNFSFPLSIINSILVGIGMATDYFDGKSSKKHNSASEFGKKLDQVVDKVFSAIICGSLAILNPIYIIPLLGEAVITSTMLPFSVKYKNIDDTSCYIGKVKQWPLGISFMLGYISILSIPLNTAATALVLLTFIFQLITAATYLKRNLNIVNSLKRKEHFDNQFEIDGNFEKEKILEKSMENNKNISVAKLERKEKCDELKKLKEEIVTNKQQNVEEKIYQKRKK